MRTVMLILCCFILGCSNNPNDPSSTLNPNSVVVVEGCEYFKVNAYASYSYTHKGNCKNPIHCYNETNK